MEERREASARAGWRGGVLEERRFCRTTGTSRWPRAVNSDWGGLRRRSLVVRPRIEIYPRRMALRRVELEGEPRERETYVIYKERYFKSLFKYFYLNNPKKIL